MNMKITCAVVGTKITETEVWSNQVWRPAALTKMDIYDIYSDARTMARC